jgi:hypothetical protein
MTTIACDGKSMAADGMISGHGIVYGLDMLKLRRLCDGSLFGYSGSAYSLADWADWVERQYLGLGSKVGSPLLPVPANTGGVEILLLRPTGELYCINELGHAYRQSFPAASGGGAQAALAAMMAGASPVEAVAIAARLSLGTGGTISCLQLEEFDQPVKGVDDLQVPPSWLSADWSVLTDDLP